MSMLDQHQYEAIDHYSKKQLPPPHEAATSDHFSVKPCPAYIPTVREPCPEADYDAVQVLGKPEPGQGSAPEYVEVSTKPQGQRSEADTEYAEVVQGQSSEAHVGEEYAEVGVGDGSAPEQKSESAGQQKAQNK